MTEVILWSTHTVTFTRRGTAPSDEEQSTTGDFQKLGVNDCARKSCLKYNKSNPLKVQLTLNKSNT